MTKANPIFKFSDEVKAYGRGLTVEQYRELLHTKQPFTKTKFNKEWLIKNIPQEVFFECERDIEEERQPDDFMNWNIDDLLKNTRYVLSCYYEDGHMLNSLKDDDLDSYKKEIKELKEWIKKAEKLH